MDRSSILRASTKSTQRPTAIKSQARALFYCLVFIGTKRGELCTLNIARLFCFYKANSKKTIPRRESVVKNNELGEDSA